MKRHIFCSILLFLISAISYASDNSSIIKCNSETIYKYWLGKELSNQYGDTQFRSFLNQKVAHTFRTYFLQDLENCTKFATSLHSPLLRQIKISEGLKKDSNDILTAHSHPQFDKPLPLIHSNTQFSMHSVTTKRTEEIKAWERMVSESRTIVSGTQFSIDSVPYPQYAKGQRWDRNREHEYLT